MEIQSEPFKKKETGNAQYAVKQQLTYEGPMSADC